MPWHHALLSLGECNVIRRPARVRKFYPRPDLYQYLSMLLRDMKLTGKYYLDDKMETSRRTLNGKTQD